MEWGHSVYWHQPAPASIRGVNGPLKKTKRIFL
jgi:hypothetical protein